MAAVMNPPATIGENNMNAGNVVHTNALLNGACDDDELSRN